ASRDADAIIGRCQARAIAHQTAGIDELAEWIDDRHSSILDERQELLPACREEWIGADNHGLHLLLNGRSKRRIYLVDRPCFENQRSRPFHTRGCYFYGLYLVFCGR